MNRKNGPKRPAVYVRSASGWPEAMEMTMAPTNACSDFRELLEAIARGEVQVVEVDVKRLKRKGASSKNSS
jgi:hypothetical protein